MGEPAERENADRADATPAADPLQAIIGIAVEEHRRALDSWGLGPASAPPPRPVGEFVLAALEAAGLRVVPATEIDALRDEAARLRDAVLPGTYGAAQTFVTAGEYVDAQRELEVLRGVTADRYEQVGWGFPLVDGTYGLTVGPWPLPENAAEIAAAANQWPVYRRVSP